MHGGLSHHPDPCEQLLLTTLRHLASSPHFPPPSPCLKLPSSASPSFQPASRPPLSWFMSESDEDDGRPLSDGWVAFLTDEGEEYYYNEERDETVCECPGRAGSLGNRPPPPPPSSVTCWGPLYLSKELTLHHHPPPNSTNRGFARRSRRPGRSRCRPRSQVFGPVCETGQA